MSGPTVESASFRRGLWAALGVLVAVLLAYCVVQVRAVLVLILVAAFLAVALDLPVRALGRRGWPAAPPCLIVVVGALLVAGARSSRCSSGCSASRSPRSDRRRAATAAQAAAQRA